MIVSGLDTETTGLSYAEGHRIIEISLVVFKDGRKIGKWTQRIDPERTILPSAQAVHKISAADLIGCPVFKMVAPKIVSIISKSDMIVAHNGDIFDFPFLLHELEQAGLTLPGHIQTFDTMQKGRWACPDGKVPTLGELAFACDIPYDPDKAHGAEYDTTIMMECFYKGIELGYFKLDEKVKAA